jgi:uncharacterized hydrophobic protein (TIGR00271 family)
MPAIGHDDLQRMRDGLLFSGPDAARKLSRFWVLLVLAALIATAGVIGDSTATVIGAMIVAPLMTPILGTVLAIVIGDRANVLRSLGLVVAGAAAVVVIAWLMGLFIPVEIAAETNSQVAARVHPRLIDLIAALATGAVGAFALVRSDVSDTLPGVAIAISLVPPLAVVGLTLESDVPGQSSGALLLFLTNVGAILFTGLIVMTIYRVTGTAAAAADATRGDRHRALLVVAAFLVAIAVPLNISSGRIVSESLRQSEVEDVAVAWADPAGWRVSSVEADRAGIRVRVYGPLPAPDPQGLRTALDSEGLDDVDVVVELVPQQIVDLPAG